MSAGSSRRRSRRAAGSRGRVPRSACVALVAAAAWTAAAAAQDAALSRVERPSRVEVLALFVSPTDDPLADVYGGHTGVAARYGRRLGARFGLAVEVGQRSASGSTPVTGSRAELDATHGALTGRWHFGRDPLGPWDSWLGAGVLYQSVEETVRFPDEAVSADDTTTGALLGLGVFRSGRGGWGFGGEVRYSVLSATGGTGEDADLNALEVLAGVAYSF